MSIKKVFNELNTLLLANKDQLVGDIMPKLIELMSAKVGSNGPTSYKDANGKVIAVYCYYHKVWELVSEHEYGLKAGTTTGLNSMCKVGVNAWTKQQREAKKAEANLLNQLASGELAVDQLIEARAQIESAKTNIVMPENFPIIFEDLEGLETYLESLAQPKVEEEVAKPKKSRSKKSTTEDEQTN